MNRYQQQLIHIRQSEEAYLTRTEELTARNAALQRRIDDVTQQYVDEKGKTHPVACVFTRASCSSTTPPSVCPPRTLPPLPQISENLLLILK
ncbi:putative lipoprotein [Salmonella enterica subsp. enterica]|nr:putative lipoprotein [Salmonella enterica subsp. enterica]